MCSEEGCERPVLARGWCHAHYQRWYRQGSTDGPPLVDRFRPVLERIQDKTVADGDCLIYSGSTRNGYGQITVDGASGYVHRVAYELLVGPIPQGLHLDHLCKRRACWYVGHLEPVTRRENILRGDGFAATNARKTHCDKGHEYTPENTRTENGWRRCRACDREKQRLRRAAKPRPA